MTLTAKRPENDSFPPIPAGTYQAICYAVVDLGTQHSDFYGNDSPKILVMWEIPEERIEIEGKSLPRAISKRYTLSLSEKANLYKDLVSWRSKEFTEDELAGFDVKDILGANCILTVVNGERDGKKFANVSSVAHVMKGMDKKKPENPMVSFNIEEEGIDNIPAELPDWVKDLIKKSMEYKAIHHARNSSDLAAAQAQANYATPPDDDDIPF